MGPLTENVSLFYKVDVFSRGITTETSLRVTNVGTCALSAVIVLNKFWNVKIVA